MKTKGTFFILFFIVAFSVAQTPHENAAANIELLKSGALLVRLKTSENYMNVLERRGDKAGVEKVRAKQLAENQAIVKAFREKFTFCKVYFFYSNFSDEIRNGQMKGHLYNSDFQLDDTFSGSNYLVGEFGNTQLTNIEGFIIESRDYQQMQEPFPFLTRKNKVGVKERTPAEMAAQASKDLQSYYEYTESKK